MSTTDPTGDLVEKARTMAARAGANVDLDPADLDDLDRPLEVAPPPPPTLEQQAVIEARYALDEHRAPVRTGATAPELDAAVKAAGGAGSARRMALAAFRLAGPNGLTDAELADVLNAIPNRIATRRKELQDAGLVRSTNERRKTPADILALVHVITPLGLDVINQGPAR